jgi:hypothetical protein
MNNKKSINLDVIKEQLTAPASSPHGAPVDQWNPDFCGEIDLLIKRNGEWLYQQSPITRPAMVNLFARVLWLEDGRYYLKTPVEKMGIQVEDTPFHVTQMSDVIDSEGNSAIQFTTLTGDLVTLNQAHPIRLRLDPITSEPSPLVLVRYGMEALISRPVFYELIELASTRLVDGQEQLIIESAGCEFVLGAVDNND